MRSILFPKSQYLWHIDKFTVVCEEQSVSKEARLCVIGYSEIIIKYSCNFLGLQYVAGKYFSIMKGGLLSLASITSVLSKVLEEAMITSLDNITVTYILHEQCISNIILPLNNNPQVHMCIFISKASNFHLPRQNVHCCINVQVTKSNSVTLCTSEEHPSVFRVIL